MRFASRMYEIDILASSSTLANPSEQEACLFTEGSFGEKYMVEPSVGEKSKCERSLGDKG